MIEQARGKRLEARGTAMQVILWLADCAAGSGPIYRPLASRL
jgi:hypothetical protein